MDDKKLAMYIAVVLAVLLVVGGVIYFAFLKEGTVLEEIQERPTIKEVTGRQLEELDALRQQMNPRPLTSEEVDIQIEKLDALHQKSDFQQPLLQEDTEKQIEELDELRSLIINN